MSEYETVNVHRDGAAATIELSRPDSLNAWNAQLGHDLLAAITGAAQDDDVRAVVITGAGRAFSGGGDLNLLDRMVHDTDARAAIMEEGAVIVRGMASIEVPIIAAVNGPAVGGGGRHARQGDNQHDEHPHCNFFEQRQLTLEPLGSPRKAG